MSRKYYLGLDMGTNSVGWAVTDKEYNLLRAKGKDLWGIREFEEAMTAVDRRTHRISRRRRQRQLIRIGLIKDYFEEEINKKDPNFYMRLENSKYFQEDKNEELNSKNGIFNDVDYSDEEYYKQYPTIFHLRKELIENKNPHDVRLVYLTILNMFKHRGHFLIESDGNIGGNTLEIFHEFTQLVSEYDIYFSDNFDINEFDNILSDKSTSRSIKSEKIVEILQIDKKEKKKITLVKLICGLKVDIKTIFDDIENDDKLQLCFGEAGYDDKIVEVEDKLSESQLQIIECLKKLYDIELLQKIMKGHPYLSDARVAEYNKHEQDLKKLKMVYRKYKSADEYDKMFRCDESGSYGAYVNSVNSGNKKIRRNMKGRKIDDFYKKIKTDLKDIDDPLVLEIMADIDTDNFMPKQLTFANGIIPNKVHKDEMKMILKNASLYLPFLNEKDESGLTIAERILKLFSFHIPYYIGPVSENSEKNGGNGWVIRKESGQVLPWNIKDKIDYTETSKRFIERMVRRCTYISGEQVLPKSSLIYEKYAVLNEINNIKIDGEKITPELKQDIYNELYLTGKRITKKKLMNYLVGRGIICREEQVSGIDINLNNYLSSYGKFLPILGEKIKEDSYIKMVEDIIYLSTIFGDSKKMLKEQIVSKYKDILSDKDIKRILGLKFKDWGRISRKLLELEGVDKETGEITTLIRTLWDRNLNMMELIHSDMFGFKESLEEMQTESMKLLCDINVDDLDDMYFSAPVKRMVWQTLLLIKEIEKILGEAPEKLFIEMTRSHDDIKKRTDSRKKQLLELYKNIKEDKKYWTDIIESADSDGKLKSKKMYLYITQMGKCMYTGEDINLDQLFDDNLYDIDHIYPRHFVKDDNLGNNLVLVRKDKNSRKSDTYPIDSDIRNNNKVRNLWKTLREYNLITKEKYDRLIGNREFSDEQLAGFIARQMVETSQGTKGVADLIKKALPNTKIVYAKASNVSEFRNKYNLLKSRTINDFHHANDAYLNIVVGNVYLTKFTENPMNFIKKQYNKDQKANHYNLDKMFNWDVKRGNEVAWIGCKQKKDDDPSLMDERGTILTVKKVISKTTPILTRMNFEGHGGIANETLYSAKVAKSDAYIPFKSNDSKLLDVTKYGGFTSVSTAYFFLVEHDVKGKRIRTIETVPIYLKDRIERNKDELYRYCTDRLKLVNPSIRMRKIKIQSLIKKDGYFVYLSGKTLDRLILKNAVNMCVDQNMINYIKKIEKYNEKNNLDVEICKEENIRLYDLFINKYNNTIFAKRPNPIGEKLIRGKNKYINLSIEGQCKIIGEILNLSVIGNPMADLSLIGGSKKTGVMLMSKKISEYNELTLINQSVSGIYSNTIDLLTV